MHPRVYARSAPDSPALTMLGPDGAVETTLTFGELDKLANQYAHAFRALGLVRGDRLSVWKRNSLSFLPIFWGAQRAGLITCPVATHLSFAETDYIIRDSGSKILITDGSVGHAADLVERYKIDGVLTDKIFYADQPFDDLPDFNAFASRFKTAPIDDESAGTIMLYSSGTTGRPKGVKVNLPDEDVESPSPLVPLVAGLFGANDKTRYLSPAPLYHAAPLAYCMAIHRLGGHVFVMPKFVEEGWMRAVERNAITFTQMVPTMFVRLLKQPAELRASFDLTSLKRVAHAAAPCPIHTKHAMIEWLGPIIDEYYAGSEGNGMTFVSSTDWLNHPGTVGRAVWGTVHICDPETGEELPTGETGGVYFGGESRFEYHGDDAKTKQAYHANQAGWSTLGDIGHLDEEGFLYLTDRKANMIISGGVNIYPQETENILLEHPSVLDAAVLGVPDPDMGERVKAFIQLVNGAKTDGLDAELIAFTRERMSHVKTPREIEFVDQLPRTESGKLLKRRLVP